MAFVVKHGKTYKTIKCKHCDAIVAYSQKDVHKTYNCDDFFGEMHDCIKEFFSCPECGKVIFIKVIIDGELQEDW